MEELKKYDSNDIYVIGGESIYRQLLPYCDVAHVTCMDYTYQADTWFPNLDEDKDWDCSGRTARKERTLTWNIASKCTFARQN